jgi:arylsulfatase A-like enzyme
MTWRELRGTARATSGALLLFVLLAPACRKETSRGAEAPAAAPAPAAGGAGPASDEEPARRRAFELSDPRDAELALFVDGDAEFALFARGTGTAEISVESEGAPAATRPLELSGEARRPAVLALPGSGARPLRLRIKAPTGATLENAIVKDDEPRTPPATKLAGALRGRSLAIVVCDALHAGHLRCYGGARETSPNVDALARDGVRFEAARAQTSWTVPSVATLFTGLEQERHGVRDVGDALAAAVPTLAESFRAAGYATAAFVQNKLLTRETGLSRGFDEWNEFVGDERPKLLPALEKRLAASRAGPELLYVHFLPPHAPYAPPADFAGKFGAADATVDGSVDGLASLAHQHPKADDPRVVKLAALYDNHVAYGDSLLGEVRRLLASRVGEWALLFLSDHGEGFGQHEAVGHNVLVHDEMVHVPLLLVASGSALAAGSSVREPVAIGDLLPSLAELFGHEAPAGIPGRSFVGFLERGVAAPPNRVLRLSARYVSGEPLQRALVWGSFKLVAPAGRKPNALFDLATDPGETSDVAAGHPVLASALRAELARWVAEGVAKSGAPGFTPDAELERELRELGYIAAEKR